MTKLIQQNNEPRNSRGERSLTAVEDMLGAVIARRLVEKFPGTQIYVPKTLPENHSLFILGDFEAHELVKYFGGETLNIAMNILTPHERYNLIEKLAKSGKSINQIALDAGCTTRRVLQIKSQLLLANDNKEPAQKSLFD